ncbi:hypothetical protein HDU76_005374, partial [Blyttiomyces sp. JEL0837]
MFQISNIHLVPARAKGDDDDGMTEEMRLELEEMRNANKKNFQMTLLERASSNDNGGSNTTISNVQSNVSALSSGSGTATNAGLNSNASSSSNTNTGLASGANGDDLDMPPEIVTTIDVSKIAPRKRDNPNVIRFRPGQPEPEVDYRAPRLQCMASHLYGPDLHFLTVVFEGDIDNGQHCEAYKQFLHGGYKKFWKFLTYTRTLHRERGAIFTQTYALNPLHNLLGFNDIRDINKVIKYSSLLFGSLDSPVHILPKVRMFVEKDIERMGYNFTDGCGRISGDLIEDLVKLIPTLQHHRQQPDRRNNAKNEEARPRFNHPSVLQVRAPGMKGVLLHDPNLPARTVVFVESMRKLDVKVPTAKSFIVEEKAEKPGQARGGKGKEDAKGGKGKEETTRHNINMNMFKSFIDTRHSKPQPCGYLNAQVICLLIERGLSVQTLIAKTQQYKNAVKFMLSDVWSALDYLQLRGLYPMMRRLLDALGGKVDHDSPRLKAVWRDLGIQQKSEVHRWKKRQSQWVAAKEKSKIYDDWEDDVVPEIEDEVSEESDPSRRLILPLLKSRRVFGVADHRGLLYNDECVIRVSMPNRQTKSIVGRVVVSRSPCYHSGDLLILNGVDRPEFAHLSDVIVFGTTGSRPHADMLSGGDLDGDTFLVIWDEDIVTPLRHEPPFVYIQDHLRNLVTTCATQLGLPKNPVKRQHTSVNKTNMINTLTSLEFNEEIIGRVDALFLQFRKFEYKQGPKSRLSKAEIASVLNALFSASVDAMGFDMNKLLDVLQAEVANSRTSELSQLHQALEYCLAQADDAARFVDIQDDEDYLWDFFINSASVEDPEWLQSGFIERFVPPIERPNVELTVKIMKITEKLVKSEPHISQLLLPGTQRFLQQFLGQGVVHQISRTVAELEWKINQSEKRAHMLPIRKIYEQMEASRATIRDYENQMKNPTLPLATRYEYQRMWMDEKRALQDLEASEVLMDANELNAYRACHTEWKNLVSRHFAFKGVMQRAIEVLNNRRRLNFKVMDELKIILEHEASMLAAGLPIYDSRDTIVDFLSNKRVALVLSETGSGKSTCIPQFLVNELFFKGTLTPSKRIIVAQPRRNATTSLASRLAEGRQTEVGNSVGSHIGKSKAKLNRSRTVISCVTYGILLSYARKDPFFRDYSVIILDEVHEDAPDLYFLFSMLKLALTKNPEFKLILMSAKTDTNRIVSYFEQCEIIEVSGRCFRVTERFVCEQKGTEEEYVANALSQVREIHTTKPITKNSDILVFLPRISSIDMAVRGMLDMCEEIDREGNLFAFALHSQLDEDEKLYVIKRYPITNEIRDEWNSASKQLRTDDFAEMVTRAMAAHYDSDGSDAYSSDDSDSWSDEDSDDEDYDEDFGEDWSDEFLVDGDHPLGSQSTMYETETPATPANVEDVFGMIQNAPSMARLDVVQDLAEELQSVTERVKNLTTSHQPEQFVRVGGISGGQNEEGKSLKEKKSDSVAGSSSTIECVEPSDKTKLEDTKSIEKEESKTKSKGKGKGKKGKQGDDDEEDEEHDGTRRVIFCTNIAETSLTIPSIGYVIDAGLQLKKKVYPKMLMEEFIMETTTSVSA